jgi:hypothetical protein
MNDAIIPNLDGLTLLVFPVVYCERNPALTGGALTGGMPIPVGDAAIIAAERWCP